MSILNNNIKNLSDVEKEKEFVDKRKYPRYSPRHLIISSISNKGDYIVGDILDISRGGFSFKYVKDIYEKELRPNGKTYLVDFFSPHIDVSAQKIECKLVYVKPIPGGPFSVLKVDRCGFMFNLSDKQKDEFVKQIIEMSVKRNL